MVLERSLLRVAFVTQLALEALPWLVCIHMLGHVRFTSDKDEGVAYLLLVCPHWGQVKVALEWVRK